MTQGIAISSITTWAADNALASAALITASEHNTHRGNVRTDAANKLLAIQDLETSSAGTSAPTDKPIGKFWFDSTNLIMQWYEVANGTLRVAVSRDKTETLSSKTLSSPTITGVAAFPDGTAALPSITNTGDLDTGLFFPAANAVGIAALGVEPLRVTVTTDLTDAVVAILSTEESTSPTTGALTVADGLGVAGALWVGGLANIAGAATLQSTLAVTGVIKGTTSGGLGAFQAEAAEAVYGWIETGVAADNGKWRFTADGEGLVLQTLNDAVSVAANIMNIQRTGTVVDSVAFSGTTLTIAGTLAVTGVTTLTGGLAKDTSVATNSTETLLIGGVIHLDPATYTRAGVTGVLATYTLPAGTLAVDKQAVRITVWGTKSGSAASAVVQFRFNAGAQVSYTIVAGETAWRVIWYIVRTGAATQDFSASYSANAAIATDSGTDAETLANALAIDLNVSSINAADTVTQEGFIVEFLNFA